MGDGVEVRGSQISGAGLGAFALENFPAGSIVTEYEGALLSCKRDAARLDVQTHVLSYEGVRVDGTKEPQHGKGVGSFANDCRDLLGAPLPDGSGVFAYNVTPACCGNDAHLNRVFLKALTPIRAGQELFLYYGKRPDIPMGRARMELVYLPSGETHVATRLISSAAGP